MKSKKVILSALALIVLSGCTSKPGLVLKPTARVLSPDSVTNQTAAAIIAQVETGKDFLTAVYQCDKIRHITALIEHPKADPVLRLIIQGNQHGEGQPIVGHYFYIPASDGWSFSDTSGTSWKVEAEAVTANNNGLFKGYVCKVDPLKSAQVQTASEQEKLEDIFKSSGI